jgi:hypothetical protein
VQINKVSLWLKASPR